MKSGPPAGVHRKVTGHAVSAVALAAQLATRAPLKTIGGQQHYNRLSTIADYLQFVASVATQHKHSSTDASSIDRMAKTIRKHRPRGLASRLDDEQGDRSPPTELVERFMAVGAANQQTQARGHADEACRPRYQYFHVCRLVLVRCLVSYRVAPSLCACAADCR